MAVKINANSTLTNNEPEEIIEVAEDGSEIKVTKLIEKARKEEKDKLYPRLSKLEASLQERDTAIEDLKRKIEEKEQALKAKDDASLSEQDKLRKQIDELSVKLTDVVEDRKSEKEKAEKEKQRLTLEAFKANKIREAGTDIIPELVEGNTEEEIVAAVEKAKVKYKQIFEDAASAVKKETRGIPASRTTDPGRVSTGAVELTAEQIAAMPIAEWKKIRQTVTNEVGKQFANPYKK